MKRTAILAVVFIAIAQSALLSAGTPAGTVISSLCSLTYKDGTLAKTASASASVAIAQTGSVALQAAAVPGAILPGQAYYVLLKSTNVGNGPDTISLSAASEHGWGVTFIRDDNGDGVHQPTEITIIASTGSLVADAAHQCCVKVAVPAAAATGDTVTITGTSVFEPTTTAKATLAFPVPAAHSITFTQPPALSATTVASGESTQCSAIATDSLGHQLAYQWSDGGAGGVFNPSVTAQNPAYTSKANTAGSDVVVKIDCTATCGQGSLSAELPTPALTVFASAPPAAPKFDPVQVSAYAGVTFRTPHLVLHDPNAPSSVTFTIGVPSGISIDTTPVDGSLACIRNGSSVSTLKATWDPATRIISVAANLLSPSQSAEIISSIAMSVAAGAMSPQLAINGSTALAIQLTTPIPGDLNYDGLVNSTDLGMFNKEWLRWHQSPLPAFGPGADAAYDLAPRNIGVWPYWTPLGDRVINIQDATAFTECYTASRSATMAYTSAVQTFVTTTLIQISIASAPYGIYQVSVALPSNVRFNSAVDANGNLRYLYRGLSAGGILYSEYDAATRTVRITGNVVGNSPYRIASIYITR